MPLFLQNYILQNPEFCKKMSNFFDDFFLKNGNTYYDAMTDLISAFSSYKIRLSKEVSNVFLSQGA